MSFRDRTKAIRNRQQFRIRSWMRGIPPIQRTVTSLLMLLIFITKPFPFLKPMLPKMMVKIMAAWDYEMLRVYILSWGRRMHMDQPCVMPNPPTFKPKTEVAAPYRLTEEQIKSFYDNGFIGPLTLCSPEEMASLRETLWAEIDQVSPIYGFKTGRDRHLDCPTVWKLLQRPEWTERLAQFLGPDLLLWRSQLFLKNPGAAEVTWHQASTYLSEEGYKATLHPADRNELFQLTTWVAFDDVDIENGCMQFLKGSHRKINTMTFGGKDAKGFAKAKVHLEVDIKPENVVDMPMKAGQFVIFSERCIHGSPPNISKTRRRWGMAFRSILPTVKVYDEETLHHVFYLAQQFSIEKWGAVVLRGQDKVGINKIIEPFGDVRDAQRKANEAVASSVPESAAA